MLIIRYLKMSVAVCVRAFAAPSCGLSGATNAALNESVHNE